MKNIAAQLAKRIAACCTVIAIVAPGFAQPISTEPCCNTACVCVQCTCGPNCSCQQTETQAEQTPKLAQKQQVLPPAPPILPELTRKLPAFLPGKDSPRGPPTS